MALQVNIIIPFINWTLVTTYNESICSQNVATKSNLLLWGILKRSKMVCKKGLYLFPYRTLCFRYLLESPQWCDSNNYSKHMPLEYNSLYCIIADCLLTYPQWRFRSSQMMTIFVIVSRVGKKRIGCIPSSACVTTRSTILLGCNDSS